MQLKQLTSDYLDYRVNGINIPSLRQLRAQNEAHKELKFKPTINKRKKSEEKSTVNEESHYFSVGQSIIA
jgi:hypothetical protein